MRRLAAFVDYLAKEKGSRESLLKNCLLHFDAYYTCGADIVKPLN